MERGTPGYELVDKTEDLFKGIFRKLDPFAAEKAVIQENRKGQDLESARILEEANKPIDDLRDLLKEGLRITLGASASIIGNYNIPNKLKPNIRTNAAGIPIETGRDVGYARELIRNPGLTQKQWEILNGIKFKLSKPEEYSEQINVFREPGNIVPKPNFALVPGAAVKPTDPEARRRMVEMIARKSGYSSEAEFKREIINKYPDPLAQEELLYKASMEGTGVGQVEHIIAKASKKGRLETIKKKYPRANDAYLNKRLVEASADTYDMDWYWDQEYIDAFGVSRTDGLNKGDRHSILNTQITFNERQAKLKNEVEKVLYGKEGEFRKGNRPPGLRSKDLNNRIIVSHENIAAKKDLVEQPGQIGDIVLRRAGDDKLLGKIGQYVSAIYPQDPLIKATLIRSLEAKGIKGEDAIAEWRRNLILERIEGILAEQPNLPKGGPLRARRINGILQEDLVKLYGDYPFLRPQKPLEDELLADEQMSEEGWKKRGQGKREGIPPLGSKPVKEGPFSTKTDDLTQPDRPPGTPKSG